MADPSDVIAIDDIRLITGYEVLPVAREDWLSESAQIELEKVELNVRISGVAAAVTVRQQFWGTASGARLAYLFPFRAPVAVSGFRVQVDGRVLEAELGEAEKSTARETDLVSVDLGCVEGQRFLVEYRYYQRLDGAVFRFPLNSPTRLQLRLEWDGLWSPELSWNLGNALSDWHDGLFHLEFDGHAQDDLVVAFEGRATNPQATLLSHRDYFLLTLWPGEREVLNLSLRDAGLQLIPGSLVPPIFPT